MRLTDLSISELGPHADGVHRGPRGVVFVERTAPGDRIRARLRRDGAGLVRGDIVEVVHPSPFRQDPPCPHYAACGNCTLQHLQESFYRRWKIQKVEHAFRQQGLRPRQTLSPLFFGAGTRRRATFTAVRQGSQVRVGYYRRRSQEISEISSCLVVDSRLLKVREALRAWLGPWLIPGKPLDVFVQTVGSSVEIVLTGPLGRRGIPDEAACEALTPVLDLVHAVRLGWRASEEAPVRILAQNGVLRAQFGKLRVELPPAAFLQPSEEAQTALIAAAMAPLPQKGAFADLFSGCGTFTGPLLERGEVDAFESSLPAVQALTRAGKGLPLQVYRRDLFRQPLQKPELKRYDAVVFDPPRAGCPEQASRLAKSGVPVLVGISCNPATFARDARRLVEGGYHFQTLQVFDPFPWSHHVESVGVFTRS